MTKRTLSFNPDDKLVKSSVLSSLPQLLVKMTAIAAHKTPVTFLGEATGRAVFHFARQLAPAHTCPKLER